MLSVDLVDGAPIDFCEGLMLVKVPPTRGPLPHVGSSGDEKVGRLSWFTGRN